MRIVKFNIEINDPIKEIIFKDRNVLG